MDLFKLTVRNAEIEALMKDIGSRVKSVMPPGWGFTLLIFNFGEGGNLFYTSNAQREDMIKTMQEFIEKHREH